MKTLQKIFFAFVYALPVVLFFSYYPIISLGKNATMNFELSIPLIWLAIFDVVAFLSLICVGYNSKQSFWRGNLQGISDRKFFFFAIFPLYATVSAFWSANPLRTILTSGVLWLVFFAIFALLYILPLLTPPEHFRRRLIWIILIATVIVCLFCWLQCLLDVFGVPRDATLLCPGCTSWTFGFPHPSGFAIEPQFMGNLLLAPTLLVLYLLVFTKPTGNKLRKIYLAFALFFSSTLFLTLSRGAIYAYAIALAIMLVFAYFRRRAQKSVKWIYLVTVPIITFFFTLVSQGIFATLSPTSDNFISGTTKAIHQLSLGIVDLRSLAESEVSPIEPEENSSIESLTIEKSVENYVDNIVENPSSVEKPVENSSHFDGYIPASTNIRLGLNSVALDTWRQNPMQMLFGVGLGGAGVAMTQAFPEHELIAPDAIVQNEPLSLLLELGLVGIVLVLFALYLAFFSQGARSTLWKQPFLPLFVALIVAYLITLQFFSGLPNALQIYLVPPLLLVVLDDHNKIITTRPKREN